MPSGAAPPEVDPAAVPRRTTILAGIAAPIVSWGLSVVVIAGWPGYDPVAQSISLLASWATLAFWVTTLVLAAVQRGID
jgi:hypothetical protein